MFYQVMTTTTKSKNKLNKPRGNDSVATDVSLWQNPSCTSFKYWIKLVSSYSQNAMVFCTSWKSKEVRSRKKKSLVCIGHGDDICDLRTYVSIFLESEGTYPVRIMMWWPDLASAIGHYWGQCTRLEGCMIMSGMAILIES